MFRVTVCVFTGALLFLATVGRVGKLNFLLANRAFGCYAFQCLDRFHMQDACSISRQAPQV